jgi:hypothetical protein
MILISHRGNTEDKKPHLENSPDYIQEALDKGFDVEIDLWVEKDDLYLGHDEPQYDIDFSWLNERKKKLWVHCKNIECIEFLNNTDLNFFWHEKDTVTLTSNGYIWAYPGNQPIKKSIAVMPEIEDDDISLCDGICSDIITKWKN